MENQADGKEKNKQMNIEVRFQRNTSKSLNKEDAIFCLKPNGKQSETSLPILVCSLVSQGVCETLLSVITKCCDWSELY